MQQITEAGLTFDEANEMTVSDNRSTISQKVRIDRFLASVQKSGFRMAFLATSNNDDALELVQETMMQLVKRYSDRPNEELRILFYRILSSRITDWYRKTAFRQKFHAIFSRESYQKGDPVQELSSEHETSLSEQFENNRTLDSLTTALTRLSKRQHQTFLLRAWQGFNVKETASIMGCSTGSVKTHYSRALQTLRAQLGDHNER